MAHSPGAIQAALTLASGANTVLTASAPGLYDIHLDIVTAATITISITPTGGSSVNLLASKAYGAGSHVIYSGVALGVGDILSINSNQADTTCFVMDNGGEEEPGIQTTDSSGASKISIGNQRVFVTYFVDRTLTAAQNVAFFVATRALQVVAASCWFDVAAGGASTLDCIKDTGTTAVAGGVSVLGATFNLNVAARTTQTGTLSATAANDVLAAGDRLSSKFSAAVQSTTTVAMTIELLIL